MADENSQPQASPAGDTFPADSDGGQHIDRTITTTSNSAVAEGLNNLISSVISDFDSRADATSRSQEHLSSSLDRLTGELDKLLEDAPSPFIMQHAARITGVRKRVKSLNTVLKSIQRRIDKMDRMLSAGVVVHENSDAGISGQQ